MIRAGREHTRSPGLTLPAQTGSSHSTRHRIKSSSGIPPERKPPHPPCRVSLQILMGIAEGQEKRYFSRAPVGPRLHWAMISSKAWRCSRSRRRSSSAMCRFHGGNPAARSPDAISAAAGTERGTGRRRERGEAAEAAGAPSEPGPGPRPRLHTRHGAALRQGPSRLCGAPRPRQRLPRHCLTPIARLRRRRPQHRCPQAGKQREMALQTRRRGQPLAGEQELSEARRSRAAPFCALQAGTILRVSAPPS